MDVADWLRTLGLEQYEASFHKNAVTHDVLPSLTAEDLNELGVTSVGHRRRLLNAIATLRSDRELTGNPTIGPTAGRVDNIGHRSGQPGAERRQLTVMFCDLVGSTELSSRLDPEDLGEVIRAYQARARTAIAQFGGFIARYVGDGILTYFGWPEAHEADAERAVRAALAVIDAVAQTPVSTEPLQVRIGIATGLVVVGEPIGEGQARQQTAIGETPNLAARLQGLAAPNSLVIDAVTHRQIGGLFDYQELGSVTLKGLTKPVPAWQVLRPSSVASRFEALRGSALTRLIGRGEEIDLLLRRWERASAGDGQIVLISGEPGIGKSRIVAELGERLRAEPHLRPRYFCSPYHQDSALYPFIEQLARAAGFAPDDAAAAKLEKLEACLARAAPPGDDVALLADLMSLPALERHPPPNLSPQREKARTLEALMRQVEGLAREQPIIMVIEDAHWIDPTSRELLDLCIERVRNLPVLLIVTFRPDFQPPWIGQPQVSLLALNRLDRRDRAALAAQIAGGKPLPDQVVAEIADRTDGVPLFVEELTKSVLESGLLREEGDRYVLDRTLPQLAIPSSLHASLMARLDRLAPVRLVAQTGAAIGREFTYSLLRAVSSLPEGELQAALAGLVASELVYQLGTPPEALYSFKHALVQDAAHGSLLRATRQQLHARIAEALETRSPEMIESQPELLAQHYAEAGLVEESVRYWAKAGRRSAGLSATAEAAAQYQRGLDQLALLPDAPERQRQELEFYSALGAALNVVKGLAAPETGHAYARARELSEQLGFRSEFLQVLYGQSIFHGSRGEIDFALRLDKDLLRLSRQRNDTAGQVLGHLSSGRNLMFAGKFAASRSALEEVRALYDPISHRSLVDQTGTHPHVNSGAHLGVVLFCLGFPDQALTRSNEAIAEGRRLAHPASLGAATALAMVVLWLVRDDAALGKLADQVVAFAAERRFPNWGAAGTIFQGWVKARNGDVTEGMSLLRGGTATFRASGLEAWTPYLFALLAGACEIAGQVEEAVSLLDEALQIVDQGGARWFAAELNRHKGRLLLRQGGLTAAEKLYRKALQIAAEQEAKLWELRAAVSLARLRRDQGRRVEARDLLAPAYDSFTEGFDTPDLKEAKALLDEFNA
jgi:class 3 adenylate cyclase/predicted ATPase